MLICQCRNKIKKVIFCVRQRYHIDNAFDDKVSFRQTLFLQYVVYTLV